MKLYAKTTSERASKGQGGNDFLDINITNDKKELLAYVRVIPVEDGIPLIYFTVVKYHAFLVKDRGVFDEVERKQTKGKKQKDEIRQQLKDDREKDAFNAGL